MSLTNLTMVFFQNLSINNIVLILFFFIIFIILIFSKNFKFNKIIKCYVIIPIILLVTGSTVIFIVLDYYNFLDSTLFVSILLILVFQVSSYFFKPSNSLINKNYLINLITDNISINTIILITFELYPLSILNKMIFSLFIFLICIVIFINKIVNKNYLINKILESVLLIFIIIIILLSLQKFCLTYLINKIFLTVILQISLTLLYLPIIYINSLIQEYLQIYDVIKTIKNKNLALNVLKKCLMKYKLNLNNVDVILKYSHCISHLFTNEEVLSFLTNELPKFELKQNEIYLNNIFIGKYELNVQLPKINKNISKVKTKYEKIEYFVDYNDIKDSSYTVSYLLCKSKRIIKFYIKNDGKIPPLYLWSPLFEQVFYS